MWGEHGDKFHRRPCGREQQQRRVRSKLRSAAINEGSRRRVRKEQGSRSRVEKEQRAEILHPTKDYKAWEDYREGCRDCMPCMGTRGKEEEVEGKG